MTSDVEHDEESASHSPDDSGDQDMADTELHDRIDVSEQVENATKTTKVNLKDPLRPRRKKARRACFACQRAHLTCGKGLWTKI